MEKVDEIRRVVAELKKLNDQTTVEKAEAQREKMNKKPTIT